MKYTQSPEPVAVNPPDLTPPSNPQSDTLQDLITRQRLAEKNKFKFHLTEADCTLLCTNAVPITFEEGQVVIKPNEILNSIYRVKCGTLAVFVGDTKIKELSKGYFVNEVLFLREEMKAILPNSKMVAITPVTVFEINIPFARQVLNTDKVLAFKMYRYLANKFSAFLTQGLTNLANDEKLSVLLQQQQQQQQQLQSQRSSSDISSLSSEDSSSDIHEDIESSSPAHGSRLSVGSNSSDGQSSSSNINNSASSSSISSSKSISSPELTEEEVIAQATEYSLRIIKGVVAPVRRVKRAKVTTCQQAKRVPFRTFTMESPSGQCLLDSEKIKFTCTIRQRKIKYNQILDMSKVGKNSVTIIYNVQAKTIFFKTEEEADEFLNLVQSLRVSVSSPTTPASPASPSLSSSRSQTPSISPLNLSSTSSSSLQEDQSDRVVMRSLAVRQDLKKGDVLIAEGDLYQRIYTIVSGEFVSMKGNRELLTLGEGETIGVSMLFHMRPAMATVVVKSETATVLIISGYKIQELVNTNFPLAVRVYKKAADVVINQVEYALTHSPTAPTSPFV